MVADTLISARVTAVTKARFVTLARGQGLSESALLKRLINAAVLASEVVESEIIAPTEKLPASGKISVRLRPDDHLLLRERARARCVPTGTYVSFLIRSHLRVLAPLLPVELAALKSSLAELSAIGRNLNQIAHALNRGEHPFGPSASDLTALLRALAGLRDHIKGVITTNLTSWDLGYEKTSD
jgi:hypothetical protein